MSGRRGWLERRRARRDEGGLLLVLLGLAGPAAGDACRPIPA